MIFVATILILLATAAVVCRPLFFSARVDFLAKERPLTPDFDEKDATLGALSELNEDYELGRLSDDDYNSLKGYFQKKYVQLKSSKK